MVFTVYPTKYMQIAAEKRGLLWQKQRQPNSEKNTTTTTTSTSTRNDNDIEGDIKTTLANNRFT